MPSLEQVEKWRRIVPEDFQFSVRAHQSITHKYKLQSVEKAFDAFEKMKHICNILRAKILHFQTPPSLKPNVAFSDSIRNFFASADLGKLRLALELRGLQSSKLPDALLKVMYDYNMIHCVDLSKGQAPSFESDIMYTRLFGKGRHNVYQPTDEELVEIDKKASRAKSQRIVMSFHFVRMYTDAARLKIFKQSGKFPMVTKSTGSASLEEILSKDAKFPTTKRKLISSQGWKLFDLSESQRVRASEVLKQLQEGKYNSVSDVMNKLEPDVRTGP